MKEDFLLRIVHTRCKHSRTRQMEPCACDQGGVACMVYLLTYVNHASLGCCLGTLHSLRLSSARMNSTMSSHGRCWGDAQPDITALLDGLVESPQ